ncbi:MAG: hypothetical protein P0S96_00590 [Simkaniaceae bacterium]|nr:hypothetical protein [Candidatus Sacchlamyda saccharinae]
MRIQITTKFRPFSHRPGIRSLIPYTTWEAQVFPTKVFLRDLKNGKTKELTIAPSTKFTVMLDLEKGRLLVCGKELSLEKQSLFPSKKRLYMGVHKKQDFEMIKRRSDMAEVFPLWLKLSQLIPEVALPSKPIGTMQLLEEGRLEDFFQAGFQGLFCPRLKDENYLGLIPDFDPPNNLCPLGLLHEGARQIEELFFFADKNTWHFLPALPKEFHAGRFIHLETLEGDELDIEWSKKQLKKVIIRPITSREIKLSLKKGLKTFRIRKSLRQSGELAKGAVSLKAGQTLYLDRFTRS